MNFLAHLFLSGDDASIMVGNFMGDFVKGQDLDNRYEPGIVKGIELHRGIDSFTDSHPVVLRSKVRLRPQYRHYAPVIVDVFYDHFLAKNWNTYHPLPLTDYANHAYSTIESFSHILPPDANTMLPYMKRDNWLVNYAHLGGIERALAGMSRRSKFNPKMDGSVANLQNHYQDFKNEFEEFFPSLQQFSTGFITGR